MGSPQMLVEVEAIWELPDHSPVVETPEAGVFLTEPEPDGDGYIGRHG